MGAGAPSNASDQSRQMCSTFTGTFILSCPRQWQRQLVGLQHCPEPVTEEMLRGMDTRNRNTCNNILFVLAAEKGLIRFK